jgi:ATP-dependent DNA helicase RecQ
VGKGRKKIFWRRLADAMLHDGLLCTVGGKFPTLALTPAGEDVLYGRGSYTLHLVKEVAAENKRQETPGIVHEDLFEQLRELRRTQAEEQNVPPYVVFSDKSLRDMCCLLPATPEEMPAVNGVGRAKMERYGQTFTTVISQWLDDHPDIERPVPQPYKEPKPIVSARNSSTVSESAELAGKGLSLGEIADRRGLKASTIATHLATWIEVGNQLEIDQLIDPEIRKEIEEQFTLLGTEFLKPVIEALQGRAGYDEARIVRAYLRCAE